jgi:hypothetical protein
VNATLDLSEQSAAMLEVQARAAHMPPESYLSLLAKYGPGPTEEEPTKIAARCLAASANALRDCRCSRHPRGSFGTS